MNYLLLIFIKDSNPGLTAICVACNPLYLVRHIDRLQPPSVDWQKYLAMTPMDFTVDHDIKSEMPVLII